MLAIPSTAYTQMKYVIQWRDQYGTYRNYQTQHGRTSAYRTAETKAQQTGKVYRIVDGDGNLVDLFYPWDQKNLRKNFSTSGVFYRLWNMEPYNCIKKSPDVSKSGDI